MRSLSVGQKYRLCQAVCLLGVIVILYCLVHMSAWSGAHHDILLFAILLAAVVLTLPFAVALYYYRAKQRDRTINSVEAQMQALNQAGQALREPTRSSKSDIRR